LSAELTKMHSFRLFFLAILLTGTEILFSDYQISFNCYINIAVLQK